MLQRTPEPETVVDSAMLDVPGMLYGVLAQRLPRKFELMFDERDPACIDVVLDAAHMALHAIARSDALYHNVEHTAQVTLVGAAVLYGRQLERQDVTPAAWLNTLVALLCHDIGYVRGICRADRGDRCATGVARRSLQLQSGASDAALMPVHVDRGKCFVAEYFAGVPLVDVAQVQANIERTRFPVPDDPVYQLGDDYPGLVRAADLIGQLGDRRYLHKLSAVFYEFEEVGYNAATGYRKPGDLLASYPEFFRDRVQPYIADAVRYLKRTEEGRDILAHLEHNLAAARRTAGVPA